MALGMLCSTLVTGVLALTVTRLITGFGIGGMLATTNALVAEYSNDRRRNTAVTAMATGYPIGAIAGGTVASALLTTGTWRDVFLLGAGMSAALIPLIPLLLPEPPDAQARRSGDALAWVNRSLHALGHGPVKTLPTCPDTAPTAGVRVLFSPSLRPVAVLLTMGYVLHIMTFYFILKWVPKIVVDMGFSPWLLGASWSGPMSAD
jgi:MFS family permease